jgi:hypothetical protein
VKYESPERKIQRELYRRGRLIYLAEHRRCECGCGASATEIHHKAGCEGWLLCWIKHWMATARNCHRWITTHGRAAAQLKQQAAQIQKVSAQLEASKPAPQVVNNTQ